MVKKKQYDLVKVRETTTGKTRENPVFIVPSGAINAAGAVDLDGNVPAAVATALALKQTIVAKVYEATMDMDSGGVTNVVVADGNTVGAIVWSRDAGGRFEGLLTGAFTQASRVFFQIGAIIGGDNNVASAYFESANKVVVEFYDGSGNKADPTTTGCSVRITADLA